jgi:hypothetical protein
MEANYYNFLKKEIAAGRIYKIDLQPEFILLESFKKDGKTYREMKYIGDFKIYNSEDPNDYYIVDTKGFTTVDFKLKLKLFHYRYRYIKLLLITYDSPTQQWCTLEEHKKLIKERKRLKQEKKNQKSKDKVK